MDWFSSGASPVNAVIFCISHAIGDFVTIANMQVDTCPEMDTLCVSPCWPSVDAVANVPCQDDIAIDVCTSHWLADGVQPPEGILDYVLPA